MVVIIYVLGVSFLCQGLFGRYCGRLGSSVIGIGGLLVSSFGAFGSFYEIGLTNSGYLLEGPKWFNIGTVQVMWGLSSDGMTSTMALVVLIISTFVHIYSFEYMKGDAHSIRFMSYLTLFTFFMLVPIASDNFIQMFVGWEGVGLVSYLLINYWFTRVEANKSALKALIVNRVGDYGLGLGTLPMYYGYRSVEFDVVFGLCGEIEETILLGSFEFDLVFVINLFILCGAIGKSAQLGLHAWLPDAMEGPTPVSASIHAATMVTAGIFVIIRCASMFECSSGIKAVILLIGGLTAVFAGTVGMVQNDIKKVIAFPTCSQLGYMFVACGFSAYTLAFFHLLNHAFFKALLFLGAGSIIHGLSDEQDMRRMGGLINLLPFTYVMMLVGSLSIIGFPYLSGFYSKELILNCGLMRYTLMERVGLILLLIAVIFTASYSIRLIKLIFYGDCNVFYKDLSVIVESGFFINVVLLLLAIGSIVTGFFLKDFVGGVGSVLMDISYEEDCAVYEFEFGNVFETLVPIVLGILGLFCGGFIMPRINRSNYYQAVYSLFVKRWYMDLLINEIVAKGLLNCGSYGVYKVLDRGSFARIGAPGLTRFVRRWTRFVSGWQSGDIVHYLVLMVFFMCLFILSLHGGSVEGIWFVWLYSMLWKTSRLFGPRRRGLVRLRKFNRRKVRFGIRGLLSFYSWWRFKSLLAWKFMVNNSKKFFFIGGSRRERRMLGAIFSYRRVLTRCIRK